ncbi:MAG: hypothetical protein ACT4P4_13255 [Betaproteobacteria bacterium]
MRGVEQALIALYGELGARLFSRKMPEIRNTDGDAFSPRRVVFEVPSAQDAFDALKHLALGQTDAELLEDAGEAGARRPRPSSRHRDPIAGAAARGRAGAARGRR